MRVCYLNKSSSLHHQLEELVEIQGLFGHDGNTGNWTSYIMNMQ